MCDDKKKSADIEPIMKDHPQQVKDKTYEVIDVDGMPTVQRIPRTKVRFTPLAVEKRIQCVRQDMVEREAERDEVAAYIEPTTTPATQSHLDGLSSWCTESNHLTPKQTPNSQAIESKIQRIQQQMRNDMELCEIMGYRDWCQSIIEPTDDQELMPNSQTDLENEIKQLKIELQEAHAQITALVEALKANGDADTTTEKANTDWVNK